MTGNTGVDHCALCGGRLTSGKATIPFLFGDSVVVIKAVPAEICQSCHEPFMIGSVTDKITALLEQVRKMGMEVLILTYSDYPGVLEAVGSN